MQPSWAGRGWLLLDGSVFLQPSSAVVGKRCQGLVNELHVLLHYHGHYLSVESEGLVSGELLA